MLETRRNTPLKIIMYIMISSFLLLTVACGQVNETEPNTTAQREQTTENGERLGIPGGEAQTTYEQAEQLTFSEVIEEYKVLDSYQTDSPGTGLGEGMEIIHRNKDALLAKGHQGYAVEYYQLLTINEQERKIVITHRFYEDSDEFATIETYTNKNEMKEAVEWVQSQPSNEQRLYFSTDESAQPTLILLPADDVSEEEIKAIEVVVNDTTYIFGKHIGLAYIHYHSDEIIMLYGEGTYATNYDLLEG